MGALALSSEYENSYRPCLRVIKNTPLGSQNYSTEKSINHLRLVVDNTADPLTLERKIAEVGRFLQKDPHPGKLNLPTSVSKCNVICNMV